MFTIKTQTFKNYFAAAHYRDWFLSTLERSSARILHVNGNSRRRPRFILEYKNYDEKPKKD